MNSRTGKIKTFLLIALLFAAQATSADQCNLFDDSLGQLLPGTSAKAELWWVSSGSKVSQTRRAPSKKSDSLRISLAANEAEAAQFVLRTRDGLENFTIQFDGLKPDGSVASDGPIPTVDILRVRYVPVQTPTDKLGVAAPWPDPLPPLNGAIALEGGVNQPFWVRVSAPKGTPAGVYTGKIRLTATRFKAAVPLRVQVYGFELPDKMTCTSAFGFSPALAWKYHNAATEDQKRQVVDMYMASFSSHRISPYDPAPMDQFLVKWDEKNPEGPVPTFDFSKWDAAMDRAFSHYNFNSFNLRIEGMGSGTFHSRTPPSLLGFAEDTPQYKRAFDAYCKTLEDHLRDKGWLPYGYVYWFDEPDPKDYEFVMNGFRKLREAAPGINRMLTEQVEPQLAGGPNIWCLITDQYKKEPVEAQRKAGDKFWWYVCTGPKAPYCTLFIDHPATELRVWLWQTWQRGIGGILVWQSNYWHSECAYPDPAAPQNPYEDPMGWMVGYDTPKGKRIPWGNGDGRFIYPPEAAAAGNAKQFISDAPVDSIRWEMLRDGVEDYEYHAMLARLLEQKGASLSEEKRAELEGLLKVPEAVTTSMTEFTKDPEPLEKRREELAAAIAEISRD